MAVVGCFAVGCYAAMFHIVKFKLYIVKFVFYKVKFLLSFFFFIRIMQLGGNLYEQYWNRNAIKADKKR